MNVEDIASKISVIFGIQHDWRDQIYGFMFLHVWVFWPVPDMTYNVFGGTLNLAQLNSPGSAETLARGGGITNHHLIAYSLSNISA